MLTTPLSDTGRIVRPAQLAQDFIQACRLDVEALKPGNVGLHGDGHRMQVADFITSAAAAAAPLCRADATVGERISGAVRATWQEVGCNTNLGIVLGCAPIAHAALHCASREPLDMALQRTLSGLTVTDASHAYEAIRLVQPAGLGKHDRHDVAGEARITLQQAMQLAAHRDSIAALYATRYALVVNHLLPVYLAARRQWDSAAWAAAKVFMFCLALIPDTHIMRKHGPKTALSVRDRAVQLMGGFDRANDPAMMQDTLMAWDHELKTAGVNPGTSADLTVVTAFLARALEYSDA